LGGVPDRPVGSHGDIVRATPRNRVLLHPGDGSGSDGRRRGLNRRRGDGGGWNARRAYPSRGGSRGGRGGRRRRRRGLVRRTAHQQKPDDHANEANLHATNARRRNQPTFSRQNCAPWRAILSREGDQGSPRVSRRRLWAMCSTARRAAGSVARAARNASRFTATSEVGSVATTVAMRGASLIRAISPKM